MKDPIGLVGDMAFLTALLGIYFMVAAERAAIACGMFVIAFVLIGIGAYMHEREASKKAWARFFGLTGDDKRDREYLDRVEGW